MSEPQYGYSLRHRSDLFDVHVGQRIALKRALCDLSSSMNVPSVYTIAEALTRSSRWMASKTNGRIPLHKYIYNFYRNQYPLIPFHSRKEDENELMLDVWAELPMWSAFSELLEVVIERLQGNEEL
jgi:hypothetical protein